MTAELDWIDDAEELLRQHYSQAVLALSPHSRLELATQAYERGAIDSAEFMRRINTPAPEAAK